MRCRIQPTAAPVLAKLSMLGNLAAERLIPGEDAGRWFAQNAARHVWAMPRVEKKRVVELGCGLGQGCELLSWTAAEVVGIDIDADPISAANRYYARPRFKWRTS